MKQEHVEEHCHTCKTPESRPLWQDHGLWGLALIAFVLLLGHVWAGARLVSHALWGYLSMAGWAVALGLLLGGLIEHYIPTEVVSRWLTGRHRRMIFASAGLGFLASSCSHGCLALSMELYRKGASVPAVITFLLASPWASLSLTLLILSLMGWHGLMVVLAALIVALTTGFIFQGLERRGIIGPNPHTVEVAADYSIAKDLKARFLERKWTPAAVAEDIKGIARGSWNLAQMVLFWVALGFTLSSVLGTVVPPGWWSRWMGPSFLGLLTTLAFATVIEVCSEGTAPLAVELFRRTGALGNAFTFLMAGVVTDFTELSVVWANMGPKVVGWVLVVTLPQVFLIGWLMNTLVLIRR